MALLKVRRVTNVACMNDHDVGSKPLAGSRDGGSELIAAVIVELDVRAFRLDALCPECVVAHAGEIVVNPTPASTNTDSRVTTLKRYLRDEPLLSIANPPAGDFVCKV